MSNIGKYWYQYWPWYWHWAGEYHSNFLMIISSQCWHQFGIDLKLFISDTWCGFGIRRHAQYMFSRLWCKIYWLLSILRLILVNIVIQRYSVRRCHIRRKNKKQSRLQTYFQYEIENIHFYEYHSERIFKLSKVRWYHSIEGNTYYRTLL